MTTRSRRTDLTATLSTVEARHDLYIKMTMLQASIASDFQFVWQNLDQFAKLDKKFKKKVDDGSILSYGNVKSFIEGYGFKAIMPPNKFEGLREAVQAFREDFKSHFMSENDKKELIKKVLAKTKLLDIIQKDWKARAIFFAIITQYDGVTVTKLDRKFFQGKGVDEMQKIFFAKNKVAKAAVKNDSIQEKEIGRESGKWETPYDDGSDTLANERSYRWTRDFINYYIPNMAIYAIIAEYIAPSLTQGGSPAEITETAARVIQNIRVYKMSFDLLNTKDELTFISLFMHLYQEEMYYTMLNYPAGLGQDKALPKDFKFFKTSGSPVVQKMDDLIPYKDKGYAANRKLALKTLCAIAKSVEKNVAGNKENNVNALQSLRGGLKIVVTAPKKSSSSTAKTSKKGMKGDGKKKKEILQE